MKCYQYYIEVDIHKLNNDTLVEERYFSYGDVEYNIIKKRRNINDKMTVTAYSHKKNDKEIIGKIKKEVYKIYFEEIKRLEQDIIHLKDKGKKIFKTEIRLDKLERIVDE